jgi:hypothetical protein
VFVSTGTDTATITDQTSLSIVPNCSLIAGTGVHLDMYLSSKSSSLLKTGSIPDISTDKLFLYYDINGVCRSTSPGVVPLCRLTTGHEDR